MEERAALGARQARAPAQGRTGGESRWLKLARVYTNFVLRLSHYNPAGDERDGFGPNVRLSTRRPGPVLIELLCAYFCAKLGATIILQHQYNKAKAELELWDERKPALGPDEASATANNASAGDKLNRWSLERAARQERLERAVGRVELVGNAFYEFGFGTEALYVFGLLLGFIVRVLIPLGPQIVGQARFGVIQALLNPARERSYTTERQIGRLTADFLASSANYTRAQAERLELALELQDQAPVPACSGRRDPFQVACAILKYKLAIHQLRAAHKLAKHTLGTLRASGELVPPNRRPEWIERLAIVYLLMAASTTCLVLFIIPGQIFIVPLVFTVRYKLHLGVRDIINMCEVVGFAHLGLQCYILVGAMIESTILDQLKLVGELQRAIISLGADCSRIARSDEPEQCERAAKRVSASLSDNEHKHKSRELSPAKRARLDAPLLRILIHYKLLKGQMRATHPTIGFILGHTVLPIVLLPLMGRLHMAYLSPFARKIYASCAIFIIVIGDIFILPSCFLHARCLGLYRRLESLQARLDAAHTSRAAVCTEHSLWLLRRELHAPEISLRQFVTRALFLELTYAGYLGIHFYCGILLTPLLLGNTHRRSAITGGNALFEALSLF